MFFEPLKRFGFIFLIGIFPHTGWDAAAREQAGMSKQVYLAARVDGKSGSGTKADPFDASSAHKYTDLLSKLEPNYIFHYAPGVYETYGWRFLLRKTAGTGCKHYGAGIDRTIIKLVGASHGPADGIVFASSYNERADGFELHDLTINCNAAGQPKWKRGPARFVSAISTRGSGIRINNVKVTRFGTRSVGTECFPIFIASDALAGNFSDNVVENCVISQPADGNRDGASLISVGPFMSEASGRNNVARNNRIDVEDGDLLYAHGPCAQLVESNFIKGCSDGVYTEPSNRNGWQVVVRDNAFVNCAIGVSGSAHVGSMAEGYLIEGNRFTDCPVMVFIRGDDNLIHYREIIVRQNRFRKSRRAARASLALYIASTNNVIVTGNVVDSVSAGAIQVKAMNAKVQENRTSKGRNLDVVQ